MEKGGWRGPLVKHAKKVWIQIGGRYLTAKVARQSPNDHLNSPPKLVVVHLRLVNSNGPAAAPPAMDNRSGLVCAKSTHFHCYWRFARNLLSCFKHTSSGAQISSSPIGHPHGPNLACTISYATSPAHMRLRY